MPLDVAKAIVAESHREGLCASFEWEGNRDCDSEWCGCACAPLDGWQSLYAGTNSTHEDGARGPNPHPHPARCGRQKGKWAPAEIDKWINMAAGGKSLFRCRWTDFVRHGHGLHRSVPHYGIIYADVAHRHGLPANPGFSNDESCRAIRLCSSFREYCERDRWRSCRAARGPLAGAAAFAKVKYTIRGGRVIHSEP